MAQNIRKTMAENERLKTLAYQEQMSRRVERNRYNRIYYIAAIVWAVMAALPSIYIARPLPYMLGSVVQQNLYSRVDFKWQDANAEAQALRNLETTFARRYREEPLGLWAAETHGPLDQLLVSIAAADDAEEAAAAAKDLNINVTRQQIETLWRGASVARNDPFHYLVTPLKEVLDNEIFPQGIIDDERFERERGRTIQISRGGSSVSAMVGGERGPTTKIQLEPVLERRLKVRMSNWLPDDFKSVLKELIVARIKPTLKYDQVATAAEMEERRVDLLSRVQNVHRADLIASRGEALALNRLAKLHEEDRVYRESQGWRLPITRFAGNLLLFAAVSLSMVVYFRLVKHNRLGSLKRFITSSALCLVPISVGYWLIYMGLPGTMLPLGLIIGIAAFGTDYRTTVFLVAMTCLCSLILYEGRPDLMIGFLAAGLFYTHTAPRCRRRFALLVVSFLTGLIGALAYIAWNLAQGDMQNIFSLLTSWSSVLDESRAPLLAAAGLLLNWTLCGIIVLMLLPIIEKFFGITTSIHLQDLSGHEHPILRRLILEAPGTYHHSSIVSTLAEAAADAIGADGLKARIGGLFHDIGKLQKPEYFTENEAGVSRHANMNPNMSALLIINHVRDGVEMARAMGLPNLVIDMIQQHHGDSLMKYFYHKAQTQAPEGAVIPKESFLYPGPRPQSPEVGVLMISDAVEAAVRSLDSPSPKHLRDLVSRLIQERLVDGEFEESGLSMSQLARVEEVIFRMLASMYHTRVKYPGQEKSQDKKGRKR